MFDSYVSTFDSAIGKYITFNYTLNNLVGQFTITDISATHVPGLSAPSPASGDRFYTVTCTDRMYTGSMRAVVPWPDGMPSRSSASRGDGC